MKESFVILFYETSIQWQLSLYKKVIFDKTIKKVVKMEKQFYFCMCKTIT